VEIIERIPKPPPPPKPPPEPIPPPPEEKPKLFKPAEAPIEAEPEQEEPEDVIESDSAKDSYTDNTYTAAQLDNAPLKCLNCEEHKPLYPPIALKAELRGFVELKLLIDKNGAVVSCDVLKVEGFKGFGDKAAEAALKWKFEVPILDGQPVQVWLIMPIRFDY
ncbi:MAG: energy transducer TonB, partial [bacterium]